MGAGDSVIEITAYAAPYVAYTLQGKEWRMLLTAPMCELYLSDETHVAEEPPVWKTPELNELTIEQLLVLVRAHHKRFGEQTP
jgi:hypothetical protein